MSNYILSDDLHKEFVRMFNLPSGVTNYSIHLNHNDIARCDANFNLTWRDEEPQQPEITGRTYEESLIYIRDTMAEAKEIYETIRRSAEECKVSI